MQFSEEQILEITDQGSGGEGVARAGGKVVFVDGALKGEIVRARITHEKKDFCNAKTVEIIKDADFRVMPVCPSFSMCGGCDLLHMEYSAQLLLKRQSVKNCLEKVLKQDISVSEVIPSPDRFFYRNKIRVSVVLCADSKIDNTGIINAKTENETTENAVKNSATETAAGKKVKIGFFSERTHSVVPFEKCFLQKESHLPALAALRKFANKNRDIIYDESTGKGSLRYVTIQDFAGIVILSLDTVLPSNPCLKSLNEILKKEYNGNYALYTAKNLFSGRFDISQNINFAGDKEGENKAFITKTAARDCIAKPENLTFISGKNIIRENVFGIKTRFHPLAFRQVNDGVKDLLYDDTAALCGSGCVIDAYSGCGLMSMMFAKKAEKVFAVEIDSNACATARVAINENAINNVEIICGDCKIELPKIAATLTIQQRKNLTIVLDPPRKGCDPQILKCVREASPDSVIYISCNPATLARDLAILLKDEENQWEIALVQPFDMFPQTAHIETLLHIKRKV